MENKLTEKELQKAEWKIVKELFPGTKLTMQSYFELKQMGLPTPPIPQNILEAEILKIKEEKENGK